MANISWVLEWVTGGHWAPRAAMLGSGETGLPVAEGRLRPRCACVMLQRSRKISGKQQFNG